MVTFPIRVTRNRYAGSNPRKRAEATETNRIAAELEKYINNQLETQTEPTKTYLYHDIATATGYDVAIVRDLCFAIDCGHNGFTALKVGMSFEQATQTQNLDK